MIKLLLKERIGGKIHRRYDSPKTPYQRVMTSKEVPEQKKQELKRTYQSLNPAELKRAIDRRLDLLYKVYQKKNKSLEVKLGKKLKPISLTSYMIQPRELSLT